MEKQTIKQLPKIDRPREKLISKGAQNLKDAELLAILLNTGIAGENVLIVAGRILKQYSKREFFNLNFKELSGIKGIGQTKACLLLASAEFIKRALEVKEEIAPIIKSVDDVVAQSIYMKDKQREHFMVL